MNDPLRAGCLSSASYLVSIGSLSIGGHILAGKINMGIGVVLNTGTIGGQLVDILGTIIISY